MFSYFSILRRMSGHDIARSFIHWVSARAFLHRGYWLVASLYLVFDAHLSAFQLVFVGTAQSVISLIVEVPAGIIADTLSRKWAIVISQVIIGASMVATGMVTSFPALVATQMLWGVGWTFVSGADVAWLTDELEQSQSVDRVLVTGARWQQVGAIAGMTALGGLAWAASRATAMIAAGVLMMMLAVYVARRFSEHHFVPVSIQRWNAFKLIFRQGIGVARHDHEVLLVFVGTFLICGAMEGFAGRIYPRRLAELGFPQGPSGIIWFTVVGIVALVVGACGLRVLENRIDGIGAARRFYFVACIAGAFGLGILAVAPNTESGIAGILIIDGFALTMTRSVSVIWVNRRIAGPARATVQSFLAQVEYLGEIICGFGLGAIAQSASLSGALVVSAALVLLAGVLVRRARVRQVR